MARLNDLLCICYYKDANPFSFDRYVPYWCDFRSISIHLTCREIAINMCVYLHVFLYLLSDPSLLQCSVHINFRTADVALWQWNRLDSIAAISFWNSCNFLATPTHIHIIPLHEKKERTIGSRECHKSGSKRGWHWCRWWRRVPTKCRGAVSTTRRCWLFHNSVLCWQSVA